MKSVPTRECLLVALGSLAFGLFFSYPVLAHFSQAGQVWDWDLFQALAWVSYRSAAHYHQVPLWNPYLCGGMPMLADPSSRIATPFFLLHLLFGSTAGGHLEIPLHLAIAFAGGYVIGRLENLRPLACVACAGVFPASSWLYLHTAAGHMCFLSWLYLPWIAAFVLLAVRRRAMAWAAMCGLVVALMFNEGSAYPPTHAMLLVAVLCAVYAITQKSFWPIMVLMGVGLFAVGFSAVKLLPSYTLNALYPRPTDISFTDYSIWSLPVAFFARDQVIERASIGGAAFFEYGAYVSPLAVVLVAIGIIASPRRLAPWIVAALMFLILAAGEGGFPYAWQLLHHLPLFSSERVTPRFLVPFVLTLSVMAGYGADFLQRRFGGLGGALSAALIALAIVDAWSVTVSNLSHVVEMPDPLMVDGDFRQFATGYPATGMYNLAKRNMGDPTCWQPIPIANSAVGKNQPNYRGEQYLTGPGTVRPVRWTPNALYYDVDIKSNTVLVINQNYYGAWRLVGGKGEVFSNNGALAIRLPPGAQRVELRYVDHDFIVGAIISLITAITAIFLIGKMRSRSAIEENAAAQGQT